jgi:hypothetical protein
VILSRKKLALFLESARPAVLDTTNTATTADQSNTKKIEA